jgi:opacity protein-like surface antigen
MNLNQNYSFFMVLVLVFSMNTYAQRDTITTDKLIIIKQYSPTVNDAFKIKQKPSEKDSIKQERTEVSYSFIDVPVASTFTPAKGAASGVRIAPPPKIFDNYARFGAGNYSTILADFYSSFEVDIDRSMDVKFSHLSSQGGIDGVVLDDDFSNTSVGVNINSQDRYFEWNIGLDVSHREVNYYGLPEFFVNSLTEEDLRAINPKQSYTTFKALGDIEFFDGVLKSAEVKLQNLSDNYSNSEQLLSIKPLVEMPVRNQELFVKADLSFLNGGFESESFMPYELNYRQVQAGVNPFLNLEYSKMSFKLGAKAVFFNDFEASSSNIFFYPDVQAEFLLNQETMKLNLGVKGDLQQNTFENFSLQNPFIAPSLFIRPSDQSFNAFAGVSTKLLDNLTLAVQGNYSKTSDYAFFVSNPSAEYVSRTPSRRNFDYQNSFNVVYDDLDILSFAADLTYQIESDFSVGLFGKYSNYSTATFEEAWNLPELEFKTYANYELMNKWTINASLFYVGQRKDIASDITVEESGTLQTNDFSVNSVNGFVDLNASVEYRINNRLSAFVNANNVLNNSYNLWQNFEVQGFQVLGGLVYQFNW